MKNTGLTRTPKQMVIIKKSMVKKGAVILDIVLGAVVINAINISKDGRLMFIVARAQDPACVPQGHEFDPGRNHRGLDGFPKIRLSHYCCENTFYSLNHDITKNKLLFLLKPGKSYLNRVIVIPAGGIEGQLLVCEVVGLILNAVIWVSGL